MKAENVRNAVLVKDQMMNLPDFDFYERFEQQLTKLGLNRTSALVVTLSWVNSVFANLFIHNAHLRFSKTSHRSYIFFF